MFLNKVAKFPRTLAVRLTLWYAAIFTASSIIAFAVFYLLTASVVETNEEEDFLQDVAELASLFTSEGIDAFKREINGEVKSEGVDKIFFRLLTPQSEELASTEILPWVKSGMNDEILNRLNTQTNRVFERIIGPEGEHNWLLVHAAIAPGIVLQIGESLEENEEFLEILRETFISIIALVMLFAALGGWLMARHALRGVDEVTQTALSISEGNFDRRVPSKARGEEIERLGAAFNYMLDRINTLITGIREITDNIAHDLKTPITRIRGLAETTLVSGYSAEEFESILANTIEDCDRLLDLINTMLDLSEAEAGAERLVKRHIDLSEVVRTACELFQPLADIKRVQLTSHLPHPCPTYGDLQKIQRMVANILDNALKYTPPDGTVTVSVKFENEKIVTTFSDTGGGIADNDLSHIFKRFYRCDQSRSETGIGLGLSLARAIAKSHGGDITVVSRLGKGSTFTIILPRAADA